MAIPNFDDWEPDPQTPPQASPPNFDEWQKTQQFAPLDNLKSFAAQNNLEVGSTTGGRHNRGSKHYSGNAIDIRNSGNFSDQQVQQLAQAASQTGLKLRDERTRPKGQQVWGGPHIHLETADAQIPKFDDWVKTSEQVPPSTEQRQQRPTPGQPAPLQGLLLPPGQHNNLPKLPAGHFGKPYQPPLAGKQGELLRQLGQQRTIDQDQREQQRQAEDEARRELQSERLLPNYPGIPSGQGILRLFSDPVGKFGELLKSDDEIVQERAQEKLHQQQIAQEPEVTSIRKEYGAMPTLYGQIPGVPQGLTASVIGTGGGGLLKLGAGIASAFGIAPNRLSDWANKRAEIIEAGAALPPLRKNSNLSSLVTGKPEFQDVERNVPEKILKGIADLGVGLGQVILLKKATGLPFNQLLALEAAAKNSDKPVGQQLASAGEAYAMGTALDSHLGRTANAALFGIPTAAATGYEVSQGRMSPLDAAIQTGIQAGAGAILSGGKEPSSLERGLAREPIRKRVEPDADIAARLRGQNASTTTIPETAAVQPPGTDISLPEPPSTIPREPVTQSVLDRTIGDRAGRLDRLARLRNELQQWLRAGGRTGRGGQRINQLRQQISEIEQSLQRDDTQAAARVTEQRQAEIERTRYSATPRFDEWVENETGQRLSQLSDAELAPLQERYKQEFAGAPAPPALREMPPLESRGSNEPQTQVQPPASQTETEVPSEGVYQTNASEGLGPISQRSVESPQKFYHRDYGEVTESPNQQGVGKRKVRVIADDGSEHVIQKAAMTGAGNQRAVPIRESPAEIQPSDQPPTTATPGEDVRPPSPTEAAPETVTKPVTETAVKNSAMDADRAARDLPELAQTEPRKAIEVHQRALDANARDPRSPDRLVQQALEGNKNLTDVETAQLRLRAQEIKNRERDLLREIDSAADPQVIKEKRLELDSLTNEFDRLSQATKKAGTEWGRTGVARQQAINEDYSLVAMRARMKAAKGEPLSEKEIADVENLHKRISDLEARLDEVNQKAEERVSAKGVTKIIREHTLNLRKQARARTREGLQAERTDLKQQIAEAWKKRTDGVQPSGLASLDPEGELSKLVGKLARNYIEDGVTRAGDLVDAVHAHISDVADLTKREVSDLISGYGVIRKPSTDPVERKLNELKSILASQSGKADVVEQGIRPLRRGQQREKPTEDQRRALRELQDAMAQHPEISKGIPSDIEQQTPLDKAKTTTRNRIEQLRSWIESGKKEVRGQTRVIPDAELTQLKAERDALQKVANLLDDPQADQRAIERRINDLNQTISKGKSKLASRELGPDFKEGAKALWTEEIGRLERERATVNKEITKARVQKAKEDREAKAATPEGQEEKYQKDLENRLKGLNKSIDDLHTKIQGGGVGNQVKEGAQSVWSNEVSALEKERATLRQIAADMRKQPKTLEPKASFYGATGSWAEYEAQARKTLATQKAQAKRITSQIAEYQRRVAASDFGPRLKRPQVPSTPELDAAREALARAKNQFLRKEREFKLANRGPAERAADLLIRWGRAAKLSYVSTLGKLTGAATGRMVMSPIENLIGEIPHRLSPELSRRATTEGGGFDRAAEVAALWKSGRFRQVLNQLTKGSSDLDVLYGKSLDKEMSSEGILGIPGRVHGALKEYPRQAETDRAFIKVLRNYERAGKDISDPQVQLAARMESVASGDRARFQQRNFISDVFNEAMGSLERKGGLAKGVAKAGRFIFPITRVPVNVAGETLNYTLGIPRAAIETAIRGGVSKLTPEQANNIMRAYKKGGVGLAVMAYAYFHPQQFGGYYQKNDRRSESEPAPGEVMFFGHRIPKWATHIPIIEAGQLAATVRRVSDKLREQGEDKGEATLGGVSAGAKGVASGIPFYETPARFFTGQEGARGWAEVVGQQGKGMIPGFVQETAQLMDKDAQGNPIKRKPTGSFAQRVGQTIELGIPGLRSQVPLNKRAIKSDRDASLIEQYRNGTISSGDLEQMDLTPAERSRIRREGKISERQVRFSNRQNEEALNRYERMDEATREEVRDIMEKKAWTLVHSDTLTDREKADFQERLDKLGITPQAPRKSSSSLKDLFRQRTVSPS